MMCSFVKYVLAVAHPILSQMENPFNLVNFILDVLNLTINLSPWNEL